MKYLQLKKGKMEWSGINSLLYSLAYVTCQLMPHCKPNNKVQSKVWWHTGKLGEGSHYERYHLEHHHSPKAALGSWPKSIILS